MATQAAFMPGTQAKPKALEVVWSWLTTVDHKRIGLLYGVSAYVFFLVGGVEALLMRLQLAKPDGTVLSAQTFNELFTMHGTTMIFLAIMPMGAAFFNFIIPLQIGARDVAFPRLNALSYWVFLSGALFLHSSFLAGSIPDAGWFGYANLTTRQFSPGSHVDFWMLGLQILGLSSLMAGFNFIVTIINMRAPGMTLMRLPLFIWMSFVVQFLVVLAFPAITVALILLMFDRLFGTLFFAPAAGADPLLWQHLFWIFGHPEVYILILPAMGIVSEVLPTFSRKPLFGAPVVIYSGIMIGFFGFGVWSHHILPPPRAGAHRDASAHLHLCPGPRLEPMESALDHRRLRDRAVLRDLHRQRGAHRPVRRPRRTRSLGRPDARVVDPLAAAPVQLRPDPAGPRPR